MIHLITQADDTAIWPSAEGVHHALGISVPVRIESVSCTIYWSAEFKPGSGYIEGIPLAIRKISDVVIHWYLPLSMVPDGLVPEYVSKFGDPDRYGNLSGTLKYAVLDKWDHYIHHAGNLHAGIRIKDVRLIFGRRRAVIHFES